MHGVQCPALYVKPHLVLPIHCECQDPFTEEPSAAQTIRHYDGAVWPLLPLHSEPQIPKPGAGARSSFPASVCHPFPPGFTSFSTQLGAGVPPLPPFPPPPADVLSQASGLLSPPALSPGSPSAPGNSAAWPRQGADSARTVTFPAHPSLNLKQNQTPPNSQTLRLAAPQTVGTCLPASISQGPLLLYCVNLSRLLILKQTKNPFC